MEEEYLYKYMTMKPPRASKTEKTPGDEIDGDEDEDPSLEEFANKLIEDKMKQIQAGSGIKDDSDEELDIQYTESEEEDGQEEGQEEDFFDGEQLSDVDIGQASDSD